MGNSIGKQKYEEKMVESNAGIDKKTGFKSSKAVHDGLRGVPAKINHKQEYVCKDEDEKKYFEEKGGTGYCAVLEKEVEKEPYEGDDN